jgi:hypothetical protein
MSPPSFRDVFDQLRLYLVAHIQGFDDEAEHYRRAQEHRGRDTGLILNFSCLLEALVESRALPAQAEPSAPEGRRARSSITWPA